ncbi:MAG: dihydropteroate synthase-like protein [Candidatus Lokiarchaeota archaeon]|nr:dihydropteroate synthase-like protein [Candidatus Lokiarchaeota archaeon]
MRILIITGQQSYNIIEKITKSSKEHKINIIKAPITISAFLTESITSEILEQIEISNHDIVLIPGFVQWDSKNLEDEYSIKIRKGPEFASDLPITLKNLENLELSNTIPANRLLEISGENKYSEIVKNQLKLAKDKLSFHTYYLNEKKSNIIIGRNLPPPIIAEIVNCTEKSNDNILKKAKHYIDSGADIIDIGCVVNKPKPERIKEIIKLIRSKYNVLLSIDSMVPEEIKAATDENIDLILSLDLGNYNELLNLPKNIPIVILPTNVKQAYFPKDPETRIINLFNLTKDLFNNGFKKLIADPLLETPISPGICPSLEAYFLYKKKATENKYKAYELPMFFGISNVVELMDIDSVGINGLLASIAIELDMGILFTVEHSTKLMGGVRELKESVKLNYIAKHNKTPPINQGISIFKAKGKTSQVIPPINQANVILVDKTVQDYIPDTNGYFRIYTDNYSKKIFVHFYSFNGKLLQTFIGENAEALSKKIIQNDLTKDIYHLNYLGRELKKAEFCLFFGKPYIQDE